MMSKHLVEKLIGLLVAMSVVMAGCEITDEEMKAINDAIEDPPQHEPPDTDHPVAEGCYSEYHFQPPAQITKKIDLLFMVDTSGSLSAEREQIGDGVDAFVDGLPEDIDINFGVMLAHVGDRAGKLYRRHSDKPLVLNAGDYTNAELRDILRERMKYTVGETETDGGEAGLYSLNRAIDADKLLESQAEGFFRDDAALVVVFVADENDICARYPDGVTPVPDPSGREEQAFEDYCADITPEGVYDRVREFMGERPLAVSGMVYREDAPYPISGENEVAYGYIEFIDRGNGVKIDLAGGRYHEGLDEIASLAQKKISLITEYELERTDFEVDSLYVEVDGQEVEFSYLADRNEVHLTDYAGLENSEVYIGYCDPQDPGNPPMITNLRLSNIFYTSAELSWETDILASSQVEVTKNLTGEFFFTTVIPGPFLNHNVVITGLEPDTLYTVRAVSESLTGLKSYSSGRRFRTPRDEL